MKLEVYVAVFTTCEKLVMIISGSPRRRCRDALHIKSLRDGVMPQSSWWWI